MKKNLKELLLQGRKKVGVWGSGFVGGTSAMAFASEGVSVTCYDVNPHAVVDINRGMLGVTNLEYWYGASMKEFVDQGLISATQDWIQMQDGAFGVHLICVPTEKDGEPWDEAIRDVLTKLKQCRTKFAIIESTLTPGRLDGLDTRTLEIGIAPRRDWFHSPSYNLKNLNRVYAGMTHVVTKKMQEVLSIVCDHLIAASSYRIAELVKSVENSLLHIPAVYATQLAHAYPDLDINEVLKLAATHWRIPHYYPSFGTGGYCIPLSSKYVKYGALRPEALTVVDAALASDAREPYFVAERVAAKIRKGNVGILGISYKGDLKVHQLSPTLKIVERLQEKKGIQVFVHDPYYTHPEAETLLGTQVRELVIQNGSNLLSKMDALILVSDHKVYGRFSRLYFQKTLKPGLLIYDNYGIWAKYRDFFEKEKIQYFQPGSEGWAL